MGSSPAPEKANDADVDDERVTHCLIAALAMAIAAMLFAGCADSSSSTGASTPTGAPPSTSSSVASGAYLRGGTATKTNETFISTT
jgi:hypothetical protein